MPRQPLFDRDEVLDQAMRLFWRQGYAATGLDQLLNDVGLARASMYRTFGSKADFYAAALDRYRELEGDRFRRCVAEASTVVDAIAGLFELMVEQAADPDRPPGCFVVDAACERATLDQRTATQVGEELLALEADFTALLDRGVETGELDPGLDTVRWARSLVAGIQGLRVMAVARPEPTVLEDIAEATVAAITQAITRQPDGGSP